MTYPTRTFDLPTLSGISDEQISVHLGLYEGYVKNVNTLLATIGAYEGVQDEGGAYAVHAMRLRLAFEFDGMRLHEFYFEQFEGGPAPLTTGGALSDAIVEQYGTKSLEDHMREVAGARGLGWVVVYADPLARTFHVAFVSEHQNGHFAGLPILAVLDLWEHAYMVDYVPATKKNYLDAFFKNINWPVVEKRFEDAMAMSTV